MNRREHPCEGREPKSTLLRPSQSKVTTEGSNNSRPEEGLKKGRGTQKERLMQDINKTNISHNETQ